jgi:hypothetical protein
VCDGFKLAGTDNRGPHERPKRGVFSAESAERYQQFIQSIERHVAKANSSNYLSCETYRKRLSAKGVTIRTWPLVPAQEDMQPSSQEENTTAAEEGVKGGGPSSSSSTKEMADDEISRLKNCINFRRACVCDNCTALLYCNVEVLQLEDHMGFAFAVKRALELVKTKYGKNATRY